MLGYKMDNDSLGITMIVEICVWNIERTGVSSRLILFIYGSS